RWNIHATTKGDSEVGIVAADPASSMENLRCTARGASVLVVEDNMVVNVIADRLHSRISWRHAAEELPGRLGQQIGLAITAAQQEHQILFRQILNGVLPSGGHDLIKLPAILHHAIG